MNWLQRYRFQHYLAHAIWISPSIGIVLALIFVRLSHWVDTALQLESNLDSETVRALLVTLAGALFTIVVFVCSALLVIVQLASAQLTPRIIAFVFRDPVMKLSLSLFVFVFAYSLALTLRINNSVPLVSTYLSVYGFVLSLIVFLYLVDLVGKTLRPSGALRAVATRGRSVVEEVYPRSFLDSPPAPSSGDVFHAGGQCDTVLSREDGTVLAFDIQGLQTFAERSDCVIELVPQVGDCVAIGDPIFRVYGGRTKPAVIDLHGSVALGQERTLQQDPIFAFRIMVDIASKALSPAINDPTTAVIAIDHIHHLLRNVAGRCLDDERIRDRSGRIRLLYRTPDWRDFVQIAVTEIRHFGGESIQVTRRLRAMLENLIESVTPQRAELLKQELRLIERSAERFFPEPEDLILAGESDLQGVGGKTDNSRGQVASQ